MIQSISVTEGGTGRIVFEGDVEIESMPRCSDACRTFPILPVANAIIKAAADAEKGSDFANGELLDARWVWSPKDEGAVISLVVRTTDWGQITSYVAFVI